VAAKNSNFVSYANGNLASQKFIDKDVWRSHHLSRRGTMAVCTPCGRMTRDTG